MGQKWPDATVRSHTVLVAWNEVHHWNGIKNPVLEVWLSCYIILCILGKGRFDVIITGVSFLYILTVPQTWAILPGPDFRCHFNGALHFMLQVLRGNVQWDLAISGPSMATISRSNTSIPLLSHMTRAGFLMSIQWWALYCANCTAWETMTHLVITSIQSRPICWCHAPIS